SRQKRQRLPLRSQGRGRRWGRGSLSPRGGRRLRHWPCAHKTWQACCSSHLRRSLMNAKITRRGLYPPLPTFFPADEPLDLDTLREHIRRLRDRGITGFVALGSNGEAVHLDDDERRQVISTVREVASPDGQVLAGAGALSTRATIALCRLAADSG